MEIKMKNTIYLLFLSVSAIILGGLLGEGVAGMEGLKWLSYSGTFAFEPGTFLNLNVMKLTFGVTFTINVAQILFLIAAMLIYYKTASKIFGK